MALAYETCLNCVLDICITSRPVYTVSLALDDALVSFIYGLEHLLPLSGKNDKGFTTKDETVLDCQKISMGMLWARSMWYMTDVHW